MKTLLTGYLAQEVLQNGQKITIRVCTAQDKEVLVDVMHHLSDQSRYFRFFTKKEEPSAQDLLGFRDLDPEHHVALVACCDKAQATVLGVGEYYVSVEDSKSAELAFAVEEEYQGMGVGTLLLKHLVIIGRKQGIREFTAFVHPDNHKMLEVLSHVGLPESAHTECAAMNITLDLNGVRRVSAKDSSAEIVG